MSGPPEARVSLGREVMGALPDGRAVERFALRGPQGVTAEVLSYGGILAALRTPDREGRLDDIVLGADTLSPYLPNPHYVGGLIGRYANRIARGRFTLDGTAHRLSINNGLNHLHGGIRGFDQVLWQAEPFETADSAGVRLRYVSPDGEEGYPGTLTAEVSYRLSRIGELAIEYRAVSDRATVVSLTQHSYFNLAGRGDVLGHELALDADRFLPVDETLIPAGDPIPVAGTPFDFQRPTPLGARIRADDEQLRRGSGYDHCFVLRPPGPNLRRAARLRDPGSGRTVEVRTTEPGLQLYSGNFLDGSFVARGGRPAGPRSGVALEPQHYPDSPNRPGFPPTTLRPGQEYRSRTVLAFGVEG